MALEVDKFYPVRLEYFESYGNAFVTLLRRKVSQTYAEDEVVSKDSLYFERSLVPIHQTKQVNAFFTPRRPTNVY